MFKGNIGTRTGRNVLEGKEIHCDSAGFDNFEDYFTDSASSLPEKTVVDSVRQNEVKSFLNPEKSLQDGDSPLSKLPSKKRSSTSGRLSFRTDAASDSDSSSIASYQPRNRLISKRGMQSFPGEEGDEKWSLEQFSPLAVPVKTYSPSSRGSISSHSHSEKKYVKRISNRGMKSFPDDDEDDVLCVYKIVNDSPEQLSPEPTVMEKMIADEQQHHLLGGGKENEENLGKIKNNENTKQLPQKSTSQVSPSSIKVNSRPAKKATRSLPVQNWYMWDDDSLSEGGKMIITPYGVHGDTGVQNKFQNLGSNLHVIDEDEPQQSSQKNWKSKLPNLIKSSSDESTTEKRQQTHQERTKSSKEKQTKALPRRKSPGKPTMKKLPGLPRSRISRSSNEKPSESLSDDEETSVVEESSEVEILVTDGVTLVNGESLPKSEDRSESEKSTETEESSTIVATSTDEEWKRFKSKKKVPKLRMSPRKKRTSLRTKRSSISKTPSPAKKSLGSVNTKSLPAEVKKKSTKSSPRNKQALTGNKKNQSPHQKKKEVKKSRSSLTKEKVPPSQKNEPVSTKNKKRAASTSPEPKIPAKRGKINDKSTTPSSNYWTRSSSKVRKSISPTKAQKKPASKNHVEAESNSEQCLSVSPSHIIMPLPSSNPSEFTQDMPVNHSPVQSETEHFQAISLGFNSPASNFSGKDADLSSRGSNKINFSTNSSDPVDILEVFDSKELNPKLDKPYEKNKKKSSHSQSDAEDGSKIALQKVGQKKPSVTSVTLPRKRRTSGPLSSEDSVVAFSKEKRRSGPLLMEDSLVAFSQGYSKRLSAEKSKSPAKTSHVSKDLNVSNFKSHEGPPDWQCLGCNGLIPQCLMTCIFCGFRRQESSQEDSSESDIDSQEEVTDWKCQSCEALIPVSLEACIFCGLCKQDGSQGAEIQMSPHRNSPSAFYRNLLSNIRGKNKKPPPQTLKEKPLPKPVGKTTKSESPVIQKASPKSMKKQSSFVMKTSYTFNSYANIKIDHKISYCVCSQSDTAIVGMMKLQKGGKRKPNCSLKEMFFTVLEGRVRVQIDNEKRELGVHDTFVVAKNGKYSIENDSAKTACLIFTIIK